PGGSLYWISSPPSTTVLRPTRCRTRQPAFRGNTNFFNLIFSGRMSNNMDMGEKLEHPTLLGNLEEHQREYIRDRLAELFTCVVRKHPQNKPANSRCRLRPRKHSTSSGRGQDLDPGSTS